MHVRIFRIEMNKINKIKVKQFETEMKKWTISLKYALCTRNWEKNHKSSITYSDNKRAVFYFLYSHPLPFLIMLIPMCTLWKKCCEIWHDITEVISTEAEKGMNWKVALIQSFGCAHCFWHAYIHKYTHSLSHFSLFFWRRSVPYHVEQHS